MRLTNCEKILVRMLDKVERVVSDFQKEPNFIGYKANSRITELMKAGHVAHIRDEGRFAVYRLTESGINLAMGIKFGTRHYRNKRKKGRFEKLFGLKF